MKKSTLMMTRTQILNSQKNAKIKTLQLVVRECEKKILSSLSVLVLLLVLISNSAGMT